MSTSECRDARADRIRSALPPWVSSLSYPVGIIDANGVVAYANEAAIRIFGIREEQLLGRKALEFIDQADHGLYQSQRRRKTGSRRDPYILRFGVGEKPKRDFLVIAEAFHDGTDVFRGSIAVFLELPSLVARMSDHLERAGGQGRDLLEQIQPTLALEHLRRENETLARLTPRQWQVAIAVYRGRRVRNVALDLGLSEHTVRTHLKSVFRKLGVISQSDLVDWFETLLRPSGTN